MYQKSFSDDEKRNKFIRWRIQSLEKSVRKLDFAPFGIVTIVQINDLKNSHGFVKNQLRQTTNQALQLLQDNYLEFVAKHVINRYCDFLYEDFKYIIAVECGFFLNMLSLQLQEIPLSPM
ncbi:hypothetical protein RYX36_002918 [Vicia faba]